MELRVEVKINPHPETLPAEKLNELFEGELVAFEKWFIEQQRSKGSTNPSPLIGVEKGIVKTYLYYASTRALPAGE